MANNVPGYRLYSNEWPNSLPRHTILYINEWPQHPTPTKNNLPLNKMSKQPTGHTP